MPIVGMPAKANYIVTVPLHAIATFEEAIVLNCVLKFTNFIFFSNPLFFISLDIFSLNFSSLGKTHIISVNFLFISLTDLIIILRLYFISFFLLPGNNKQIFLFLIIFILLFFFIKFSKTGLPQYLVLILNL